MRPRELLPHTWGEVFQAVVQWGEFSPTLIDDRPVSVERRPASSDSCARPRLNFPDPGARLPTRGAAVSLRTNRRGVAAPYPPKEVTLQINKEERTHAEVRDEVHEEGSFGQR